MKHKRVLLDIESQQDLLSGPEAQVVAAKIVRLFTWARHRHIPVVSTVLRVRASEKGPLLNRLHCIEGTEGEKKLPGTILPHSLDFGLLNTTDLPDDLFDNYQQIIFEKRDTDIFRHARAERFFTELGPVTFVVCGSGVAHGIVQAVVGLRSRGFSVIVARDAVADFGHPLAPMAYLRMEAKGAIFADTNEIVAPHKAARKVPFRESEKVTR